MTTFKSLREIVTFRGGGTPSKQVPEYWHGDIPWASVKDFTSTSLSDTQDFISQDGFKNSSANLIPKGHVIIPTRMSLGKAAINTVDLAINQDLRALVPKLPLDTQFLLHAVLSLKDEIVKKGSGATVKGITQEELYKLEIAFPPLDDQKRIAYLLGKVEGLIARRKHHLQQLDDLLKSVFLEMFGDPVRNEKGWDYIPLDNHIVHLTSGARGWAKYYSEAGKRFIRSLDVQMNHIGDDDLAYVNPPSNAEAERTRVAEGDVLLTITGSKIGRVCFVPNNFEVAYISQHVAIIRTDGLNPVFLSYYLSAEHSGQRQIKKQQYGQAKPGLNLTQIREFQIPVVNPEVQNQFAAIVEKVEGLKSRYQQSLTDLESLYGALSQKAFKGELDLSRVALPAEGPEIAEEEKPDVEEKQPMEPLFELPAPEELAVLQTAEGRKSLLGEWLNAWLAQLGNAPFTAQKFMDAARQRLRELAEDEAPDWGAAEYDELKEWVFKQVELGKLKQTRNIICINEKKQFGNQVVLRTRKTRLQ